MPHADCGSVQLYYQLDGPEDKPVLLLSNSLGTTLHIWDDVVPRISAEYRVLRYDMRGHGLSSVPPRPYTLADIGNDLLSLLDDMGITKCHFCGISISGQLGMCLAIHAPHRVEKLILANTAARIGTDALWNERIHQVMHAGIDSIADVGMERWFTEDFRRQSAAKVSAMRAMLAATSPEGYAGGCAALRDADLSPRLHQIHAPCMIVTGTFDPATPPADGRLLAQSISGAKWIELPASHLSPVELPDEFSSAVLRFLNPKEMNHG